MADRDLIASSERKDHKGKTYQVTKRFDNRLCKFIQFSIGKLSEKEDAVDIDDEAEQEAPVQKRRRRIHAGSGKLRPTISIKNGCKMRKSCYSFLGK